jgi:penicillin-binding protein 1C
VRLVPPLDPAVIVRWVTLALCALVAFEAAAVAFDLALPPDLARAHRSSPVALDRNGVWLRALPVEHGRWRIRADLDRTDPSFIRRLLAVEDAHFYAHAGVDPLAVARAAVSDLGARGIVSGGSTITMQTVRLLHPHKRSFLAKIVEALRAAQLEARFSKRQILAIYLTLAPYGGNLEGVRAASRAWFGHEPESLTLGEQALLIALPQSPEARRPDRRPKAALAARKAVLDKLVRAGAIDRASADEAAGEPLPKGRSPFPALAWHTTGRLARAAGVDQATIHTTLDAGLQGRLEALAREAAIQQGPATTAAVLVIETRSRAVRAAVGSAGLDRPGGWEDMTRALRSPGSALKPFVYAFAFDEGLAAPDTRLSDAPRKFGDYQPEDFDRTFHGEVSVREALTNSLNVPAVEVLEKVGPEAFQARLEQAGVKLVRPRAGQMAAGLALALGGAGIRLSDLATLYAGLADGGTVKPLAWTTEAAASSEKASGVRLVRAETAAQILDILRETPPPTGRTPGALTATGPRIAYKTGTSYGFRDALAAGVGGGYTVVVWTGRADGGARGGLTGRDAAAPLLFDVFDALDAPTRTPPPIAPRQAPEALQTLGPDRPGPALIFPPDGASVEVERLGPQGRGLVLAARGEGLKWFVDGRALPRDPLQDAPVWRPSAAGFYRVSVVDADGREAQARVRVKGP